MKSWISSRKTSSKLFLPKNSRQMIAANKHGTYMVTATKTGMRSSIGWMIRQSYIWYFHWALMCSSRVSSLAVSLNSPRSSLISLTMQRVQSFWTFWWTRWKNRMWAPATQNKSKKNSNPTSKMQIYNKDVSCWPWQNHSLLKRYGWQACQLVKSSKLHDLQTLRVP